MTYILLFDIQGRLQRSFLANGPIAIGLQGLSKGLYILSVQVGNSMLNMKFSHN